MRNSNEVDDDAGGFDGRCGDGRRMPGARRRDFFRVVMLMMDDAPLYVHIRFREVSNAFQERHGTLAEQSTEECSFVLAFGRGLFLPLPVM